MTIEELKAEAKKRFSKELTDEQAKAFLGSRSRGELADEELENVAGGACSEGAAKTVERWDSCNHFMCRKCGSTSRDKAPDMRMTDLWSHNCSGSVLAENRCSNCVCGTEVGVHDYGCLRDYMLETGWQGY